MRKIVVTEFVTLDNVMEDPGGAEKFVHGGWTRSYHNAEIESFKHDELFAADALLSGRVTYEGFAKAWPNMKDGGDFADRMNSMTKYVVSTTLEEVSWNNSKIIGGDIALEVGKIKQTEGKEILVFGSGDLVNALMQYQLIDEYRLLVYPVVLGSGKKLFKEGINANFKLIENKNFEEVVLLRYVV